ncbi:MAG TPA: TonB-dependent receptor [Nannocystis sp.]
MSGLAALVLAGLAVMAAAPTSGPVPEARSAPAFAAPVTGRARLSGQVLVYGSRDVVFGARILGTTADIATATDAEGRFELWLPPGEHALTIRAAGFRELPIKVKLVDGQDLVYEYRLAPDLDGNPYRTVVRQQREVAISSTNLRDDEIHALPGTFGDPFRVVKSLPGASQLAGFLPYVVVRGAAPGNTGYFLDGVRVPILFHVAIGPSVIHPYFIDQVDFYPGGAPVRLGRYVSGMIEGRTKAARRDRVFGEFDIRITDAGGIVEVPLNRRRDAACRRQKKHGKMDAKARAKLDCRRGEARGSLTLAGRYSYTAGVLTLVQSTAKINFWDYQARFDHKLGQRAQYTAFAYGSFDSLGDKLSPDPLVRFEFYRIQQRVRQSLPRGGTAVYSVALGLDRSGVTPSQVAASPIRTAEWQISPRIDVRLPLGERSNGEFGFGVDQEFQIFRSDTNVSSPSVTDYLSVLLGDRFVSATGLYAELLWKKGPIEVRPGVRTDIYAQIGPSPVLPTATSVTHAIGVDPRILFREKINDRWTLRQNFGVYHQPPSFPVPIPGVESFGFERGLQRNIQGSLGYEFSIADRAILTQDAYLGRLDNLQDYDLAAAAQGNISEFDDLVIRAKGLAYGLETMLRLAPRQRVYGWAAYTLSRSTRTFENGTESASNWDQRHILNIVLGYRIGEKWNLGGRLHFNSGRPYTTPSAGQSVSEALTYNRNNSRLPSFFQLDLRAERTWRFRTWNLQLIVDVLNSTYVREVFACVLSDTSGMFSGSGANGNGVMGMVAAGCNQQGLRYILPSIGLRGVF